MVIRVLLLLLSFIILVNLCIVSIGYMRGENLYKKYGFKLAGIRKEYYSDNKEDAMIMWNDIKVV